jgi:hypothetical protein
MQTYYIGVQLAFAYADMKEVSSMIRLAVELINNKTDGFFDEETAHVYLKPLVNESGCTVSSAANMVVHQQTWANSHGHALDGVIGDFCTDSSLGIANFGSGAGIPQISYGATSNALDNKDLYKYFARTSNSNQDMASGKGLVNHKACTIQILSDSKIFIRIGRSAKLLWHQIYKRCVDTRCILVRLIISIHNSLPRTGLSLLDTAELSV